MAIKRNPRLSEQIFKILWARIRDGEYSSGERLPAESELSEELGVSRASLRTAMAKLETMGIIARVHGGGTYIVERDPNHNSLIKAIWEFTHLIEDSGKVPRIQPIRTEERPATPEEARILRVEAGEKVIALERLFLADSEPVILSLNVTPASLFNSPLEDLDASISIHDFLQTYTNEKIEYANADIYASLVDERAVRLLDARPGAPLLLLKEVFYNADEVPIVYAVNLYNEEMLSLHEIRPWQ